MANQGKDKSIRELLRERDFGDRKTAGSNQTQRHEIFNLRTGEPVENLTAHDAAELLADETWRAA